MSDLTEPSALVVVASSAKARFLYFLASERRLAERCCLVNSDARAHEKELRTDRPGSDRDGGGSGRHAVAQPHAKDHNAELFAGQVVTMLNREAANGRIRRIILVASPRFLGLLRKSLSSRSESLCVSQISKDLTQVSEDDILIEIAEDLSFSPRS